MFPLEERTQLIRYYENMFKTFFLFLTFLVASPLLAASFNIDILDDFFQIRAPAKFSKATIIMIENKTLSPVRGAILVNKERQIPIVVLSRSTKKTTLELESSKDILEFIPYSPASQTISLIFGQGKYEIPAQN